MIKKIPRSQPASQEQAKPPMSRKILVTMNLGARHAARLEQVFAGDQLNYVNRKDQQAVNAAAAVSEIALTSGALLGSFLDSPTLKWVNCNRSGLESWATPKLFESGLIVTGSAGRSAPVLAEHALLFMLALTSGFTRFQSAQRKRVWGLDDQRTLRGIHGRKLCIIGCGATATELIRQCLPHQMDITVFRRKDIAPPFDGVRLFSRAAGHSLTDALAGSEFVALCASLNNDSYQMLGANELDCLADKAFVVNVARARLVDMEALVKRLRSGQLAGAGFDVFDPEEPLPPWHRYWSLPNFLMTPHVTPQMPDRTGNSIDIIAENYRRYQLGEPLLNRLMPEDVFTVGVNPPRRGATAQLLAGYWQQWGRKLL
jgi:phosphoglycerate dehydrogenase-like enzyme